MVQSTAPDSHGVATGTKELVQHLQGVPETMLMTLYNRAVESQRTDAILRDEKAVQIARQIDYDFSTFGEGRVSHPIRAKIMDGWVQDFLARHPAGTVVNLGVGLGTRSSRLDNGTARWVDLDLPESIALRRRFFEETNRHPMMARSALNFAWMDEVDPEQPTFFVAAGLLMFFAPEDVRGLLRTLAERFPGAEMTFDVTPESFAKRSLNGKARLKGFEMPPMPWGLNYNDVGVVEDWHERIAVVTRRDMAAGYRWRWGLVGLLSVLPFLRNRFMGTLVHLRFRSHS